MTDWESIDEVPVVMEIRVSERRLILYEQSPYIKEFERNIDLQCSMIREFMKRESELDSH